ncbi:nucleotide-binding alpha-beta plait domain-containing protein [Tanacetum coccineum]|uniref:Nucleotide-binding alpha-beta plait domain-containing protein n=1 Tax=Tanacetum coccineum TaxID=301880 RepID=A0ABQ5EQ14_9ASTR
MGIFRTKEDDVAKISTSIYVSNFPEVFSAKDLFHACKKYGHVIDSFIPFKKSKDGKRFGFVRFINVFNMERLVSNLCTIWVGRSKFHANVARFHRTPLKINKASKDNVYEPKRKSNVNENGSSKAGFTPNGVSMQEDIGRSVNDVTSPRIVEKEHNEQERINNYNGSKDEMSGSVCSDGTVSVLIMGDINEVLRRKTERFGSVLMSRNVLQKFKFLKTMSIVTTELEGAVSKEEEKKAVWDSGPTNLLALIFLYLGDIPRDVSLISIALTESFHDANLVKT